MAVQDAAVAQAHAQSAPRRRIANHSNNQSPEGNAAPRTNARQRRVDALAAKASTSDDPSRALIAEVRTAAEHLVSQLAHRQQIERRSAKQVARRLR